MTKNDFSVGSVSVLLATYNHPVWLDKVLAGYESQTDQAFEVIVADDGSDDRTRQVIESYQQRDAIAVHHVHHEDCGFQKWKILNQAVHAANHDYLIFSDGDCVPRNDFVAVHRQSARPGTFLCGGYYLLPEGISQRMTLEEIHSGKAFTWSYLRRNGVPVNKRDLRVVMPPGAARLLSRLTPTKVNFNGNNASVWKEDLVRVGGFDERMGHGGGDGEFGERLMHSGVRGRQVRFETLLLHLYHTRGYANPEVLQNNWSIRNHTRASKAAFTEHGIKAA